MTEKDKEDIIETIEDLFNKKVRHLDELAHKIDRNMDRLLKIKKDLESKIINVNNITQANALGVQNVYNEFLAIKKLFLTGSI